jgi:periplasmic protein TonB
MPKPLKKHELDAPDAIERAPVQSVKKQKLPVLLVTGDDGLWPQIGADLSAGLALKQLDSVDELISSTPSGQAAIVLWDARGHAEPAAVLSRIHLHSARFAIVALDDAASADAWTLPVHHRQVVAHVGLPIVGDALSDALDSAHEEVNSRLVLLGDGSAMSPFGSGPPKKPWLIPAVAAGVLAVAAAVFMLTRHGTVPEQPAPAAATAPGTAPGSTPGAQTPAAKSDNGEKEDALVEKAQQAMLDRHFIDPVAGSALSLYREVLTINPDNGEAQQGLQRLAEILIARVQSALDERKIDVALQFLETARSIDPSDRRITALDEKIASLRAEFGPAQILAALNAQNFDRATQLIEDAARTKAISPAKLAQLRDEVRRRRDDFDVTRLLKLVDLRMQQDHLIEPRNDSAAYYLDQAKQAGTGVPELQAQTQEYIKRLTQAVHTGIEQRRFSDVDRLITELHDRGVSAASITSLQRELSAARSQPAQQKSDQQQYLDLAQTRLAQGKLTDPERDSALFYVNQLRSVDPKSGALPQISVAVQGKIIERARTALDAGDTEKAEALAQLAAGLGGSPDLDAFNDKLHQKEAAAGEPPQVSEQSLTRANKLEPQYPARALEANVEGWVELGYTVAPNGSVTNIKVLNATPPRVFEAAATKAVSRLRYQPPQLDGKNIAVSTMIRIVFKAPK